MSRIKINYEQVIQQANKLSECAEDCKGQAQTMRTKLGAVLAEEWRGAAATAASEKLNEYIKRLDAAGSSLSETAVLIKDTANRMKAADEAAAAIN